MSAFDKAWGVVKTEEDNQCDGTEKPEGCAGDGQLSEGGAWECSSCSESFCSDCINQGHVPKEDWDLATKHKDGLAAAITGGILLYNELASKW